MGHSSKKAKAVLVRLFLLLLAIPIGLVGSPGQVYGQGGTWTEKTPMPAPRNGLAVGVINGILYAIGGFHSGAYLATNQAYDPATNTWTEKAPMSLAMASNSNNGAVVNGTLYVIGGNASGSCTSAVQIYNPTSNTWTFGASMPTPTCHAAVVAVNGLIYAMGGTDTSSSVVYNTVAVYDPIANTWSPAASMPTARARAGAGVVNGIIYVVGGNALPFITVNVNEIYNPATNTWTEGAPMPTARADPGVVVVNGLLYALGGINSTGVLASNEAYNPTTNTWTEDAPMPVARFAFGTGVVNSAVYAVGGNNGADFATNEAFTPVAPFAAFAAKVDITLGVGGFAMNSSFTLDAGGSIDPLTQNVTLRLGSFSTTIPAGSFTQGPHGKFLFGGVTNGMVLAVNLTPLGGGSYVLRIEGAGAPSLPSANPVAVTLAIGNNTGSTSVNANFQ